MSMANSFAIASIRARGPTRIGAIRPSFAASTAPRRELSSQGCATAVGVGASALQASMRRWYFVCCRSIHGLPDCVRYLKNAGTMSTNRIFTIVMPGKIMA